jgi:thiol-disulfide isomerase/thioredoxin
VQGALAYELQMRSSDEGDEWRSLSSAIQGTNIRKKNLAEGNIYHFRVRCKLATGWDDFSPDSADIKVLDEGILQLEAPTLYANDTSSITVQWSSPSGHEAHGYRLRYREEDSLEWTYVDTTLKNTQVKKKSLEAGVNYYFAVLPVISPSVPVQTADKSQSDGSDTNESQQSVFNVESNSADSRSKVFEYSPQSLPLQVQQFSTFMKNLFPDLLVTRDGSKRDTAASLAGKMVAVYFSAHWCGPCRQFTPLLGQVYQAMKAAGKAEKFEVVFCSADHSEPEFKSYFQSMAPWLAIDYEDDERESFMGTFKVQGIPKLVILAPDGRMITDNGVNGSFSAEMVEQWLRQCNL